MITIAENNLENVPYFFLSPGEIKLCKKPTLVGTILGSCVAITMFDQASRFGAICHSLLPGSKDNETGTNFKYVKDSFNFMLNRFKIENIPINKLEIKVFGGADMFDIKNSVSSIGRSNIEMVEHLIFSSGLKMIASDFGGKKGRKIFFNTKTGDVFVKKIIGNSSVFMKTTGCLK